jgi:D-glycero-alpha-D-manno-heptose-7-phosphate kinase
MKTHWDPKVLIRARAPLRLGLAGGGTDVSPYCDNYGGYVLNVAIDRYAYAVIKIISEPSVVFFASDLQESECHKLHENLPTCGKLALHRAVYSYMLKNHNNNVPIPLELTTFCDAPIGSGLGSSSTLVVAMIKAFVELLNLPLDDYEIARIAFTIERVDCKLQGGRQDQYSATFGGFNFMEFYSDDRVIINTLRVKNWIICELEASLLLYSTGVSRESAAIIADQSASVNSGNKEALEAMHTIKRDALVMKECLLRGDFDGIVRTMRIGWENKKRSSSRVSDSHINSIFDAAILAGALAGRISGAGGGGFMLFFVPTEKRTSVIRALGCFGGEVSNCHFTKHGAQAWKV